MSEAEFEKYRAQFGDNLPAILSYWDFAAVLMTMSILKSIAIFSYWLGEINEVHALTALFCANSIIFLACPRWTNMYATTPVFAYLFHCVFDMLFCEYMDDITLFSPDKVGRSAAKIVVIVTMFLCGITAYCQPISVCVAEWKKTQNRSELKKKE